MICNVSSLSYDRYFINLNIDQALQEQYYAWLSPDECDRAQRFLNPQHKTDFIAARGALRSCLANYIHCEPQELQFDYGIHGKPRLINDPNLKFNLAHSHQKSLIGACYTKEIGIDVENKRNIPQSLALAKRFFHRSEYESIAILSEDLQSEQFLAYWTCKEAYLKATGQGLGQLSQLELQIQQSNVKILKAPCDRSFQIEQIIDLESDFIGAVAIEI